MPKNAHPSTEPRTLNAGSAGLSIKVLSAILFLTAALAIVFSLFELRKGEVHAQQLYELEQERQTCDHAIQRFMDGSDYLTSQLQQFVIKGEREYMDAYWDEVYNTKSRDAALKDILNTDITPEEQAAAQKSKKESDSLISGEIWAMRMVSESIGLSEISMPKAVAGCRLSIEDASLSADENQAAAINYVFGPEYSTAKNAIRKNVNDFRNEIANRYSKETMSALAENKITSSHVAVGVVAFFLILIAVFAYFSHLVILPLMGFSRKLKLYEDGQLTELKESGALEIRQLARAFNSMSASSNKSKVQ